MRPNRLAIICMSLALAARAEATGSEPNARAQVNRAIGNTIVETFRDGRMSEIWLDKGGGFVVRGRTGKEALGRWVVKGARLCLRQTRPFLFGLSYCTPVPNVGMGEAWAARSPTGEPIAVEVLPGRVIPDHPLPSAIAERRRP